MKTILLLILLLPGIAFAQKKTTVSRPTTIHATPNMVDSKLGFRDTRLESDISEHPDMVPLVADSAATSDLRAYERPNDELKVGLATLTSIHYFYYKGKLESIILKVAGETNRSLLVDALKQKYGTPIEPKGKYAGGPCIWKGKLATVFISESDLDTDSLEDISTVIILSHRLQAKQKRDAAGDL